jgi:hypothetical protein
MRRILVSLVCVAAASGALPASAKDVCVSGGGVTFKFVKVKPLKKAGSFSPLQGLAIIGGGVGPVMGGAVRRSDDSIAIGAMCHTQDPIAPSSVNFHVELVGDETFASTGVYVNETGSPSPSAITLTPIDCRDVVLP